jgi:hypothetical protein
VVEKKLMPLECMSFPGLLICTVILGEFLKGLNGITYLNFGWHMGSLLFENLAEED